MLKCAKFVVAKYVAMIAVMLVFAPGLLQAQQQPAISADVYGQLKYRYIGPEGNRATSVAGVPGKPNIWYVGAASGGIFQTSCWLARWATPMGRSRSAEFSARPTAERLGTKCCSSTRTQAARTWA